MNPTFAQLNTPIAMDHQQEQVYTMNAYYDGPRLGLADFHGRPHVYCSMWTDIGNERPDVFELAPIDDETLALALEDWQIWSRWKAAFDRGETTLEMDPALPEDRRRHDELAALLAPLLTIHSPADVTATADFEWQPADAPAPGAPIRVKWTVVDRPTDSAETNPNNRH